MRRKYKFRGKTEDGNWVYGSLYQKPTQSKIFTEQDNSSVVSSETIGEYVGLEDMNGDEIYEGDIVSTKRKNWEGLYVCEWLNGQSSYIFRELGTRFNHPIWFGMEYIKAFEIVGNVHDNPELLK